MSGVGKPPTKKPRLEASAMQVVSGNEGWEMLDTSSYFDRLPENAIDNVVRFLSDSPRANNWPIHISRNILGLFEVDGELGRFMSARFSGIFCYKGELKDISSFQLDKESVLSCEMESIEELFSSLSVPCVNSFRTFIVGHGFPQKDIRCQIDYLSTKWPNVQSLILDCDAPEGRVWLEMFGKNLVCLRSEYFLHWREISTFCPGLRHLYLGTVDCHGEYGYTFWKKVGKNLETLSIHVTLGGLNQISLIKEHCRGIKRLLLSGSDGEVNDEISKRIVSYGDQLVGAELTFMSEAQMLLVKNSCSNSRFDLCIEYDDLGPALSMLGDKIGAIESGAWPWRVHAPERSVDWDGGEKSDL